jgi:ABC-type transport system involved in multi-copper enzyme maturation permease subunit
MSLLRAWSTLVWISFRRLLWSPSSLMVMFPLAMAALALAVMRHRYLRQPGAYEDFGLAFDRFTQEFVILIFVLFVVPVCALAYGTTSIGGDREDRTLLFILVRPVPRSLVLLAKVAATLPLVLGLVVASFFGYCSLVGEVGDAAFDAYLPTVFAMTVAYVCLFHLFAVSFRHSTIIALVYALFMEFFLSNMPGIVKRVAVNFYGRSLIYEYGNAALRSLGAVHRLDMPDPQWFVPVTAATGMTTLIGVSLGSLALALLIFQRREYRDLT